LDIHHQTELQLLDSFFHIDRNLWILCAAILRSVADIFPAIHLAVSMNQLWTPYERALESPSDHICSPSVFAKFRIALNGEAGEDVKLRGCLLV
jgi:hypothetical protein